MSIAGVTPTIFVWEHRHILWLALEANKVLKMFPRLTAEKQYFGHGFHTMCIQSVPVGFLAPEAGKPNEDRPVVYALRDANDQIHYVKSSKKNVAVENIMFYPHAKRLNYEEETRHRLVVAVSA
jgi:hypothetical protein